jgi:hypothetical protein
VAAKDIVVHIDLETVLFIMLIQRKWRQYLSSVSDREALIQIVVI